MTTSLPGVSVFSVKLLVSILVFLAITIGTLMTSRVNAAPAPAADSDPSIALLESSAPTSDRCSGSSSDLVVGQVTSVSQLSDVKPTD